MSLPFPTHAAAVAAVERQFLDWFPQRVGGPVNTVAPASIFYPSTALSPPAPMFARMAEGFPAANNGKLFKVSTASSTVLTVAGSVTTQDGDGDELLLIYPCPVYFATTDEGGKWVVGQYETGKPYIELEIVGGTSEPYENIGGACNYRHDKVLDVRMFTPEGQPALFNLQDRADAALREWEHPGYTMIFEGENRVLRRRNDTQTVRPGYRVAVASYRYWYVTGGWGEQAAA